MLKRDLYALRDPTDGSSLRFLPDLSRRADYLIIILEWSKPCTEADLSHILEAIPPEMRPEPNFHDSKQYYLLILMIAHNTWESIFFSYNDSVPGWFRNGSPAVNMGCWFDVYGLLKQLKCEPHVLFFEAIAWNPYGESFFSGRCRNSDNLCNNQLECDWKSYCENFWWHKTALLKWQA